MPRYIEIVPKFKAYRNNIQRDKDIFCKYFLTVHASRVGKKIL